MEKWWFNSMLSKKKLQDSCRLNKLMDSLGDTSEGKDHETEKNMLNWSDNQSDGEKYSFSNIGYKIRDIWSLIYDDTFLVRDSNGDSYSIYFDIENQIFEIDSDHFFISELESFFSHYLNSVSKTKNNTNLDYDYIDDTQSSWNNYINNCIDSYLCFEINDYSYISSDTDNYSDSYIYSFICTQVVKSNESSNDSDFDLNNDTDYNLNNDSDFDLNNDTDYNLNNDTDFDLKEKSSDFDLNNDTDFDLKEKSSDFDLNNDSDYNLNNDTDYNLNNDTDFDLNNDSDFDLNNDTDYNLNNGSDFDLNNDTDFDLNNGSDFDLKEKSSDFDKTPNYSHLWVVCENCYGLNYKKFFKSKMNICEYCGYHLKMSSSDRIELLIDQDTWEPMDENIFSMDPIEFHSEEDPYLDRICSYQRKTGLNEAVQTGIGQLNGIPIAMAVMDFQFMGGSMGSVVGEKITRLIEFATNRSLPVIIICASGGARMQEGSLSLMQMAKISSASYDYQSNKKLFYVAILTSPTTGGVTASFGMLGDVIIAEPNAYIAFAGKRVIEQTLNTIVPEGSQESEYLFDKGLFDSIVPRNPLKGVLSELFQLHGFFPLNQNSKN
uniref:Acetyl-coenzyme A carboxylase carboxyl transferase subunit beta, chloroplastic n=1 Tax=Burmannia coelestis TaxID=167573 RepID=A0A2H4EBK5_9LILI|nr:acetyl-CoA carboxylase carboxyltransferase beta [Burmannia coelestis]ANK36096.1 acetyl-CoA carboxylase carboxyltransferase beta [Burmannia coelestis]